jgi:putative glutamine amidotransferase
MKKNVIRILPVILCVFLTCSLSAVTPNIEKARKKPVIGISGSLFKTLVSTSVKSYVNEYYIDAVTDGGGIPLILPVTDDAGIVSGMLSVVDGLILSGGADVNPLSYGEEPHPSLEMVMPRRDAFESELLKLATEQKMPVLGICRGEQFINVYFGGTLYQDIHDMTDSNVKHRQLGNRELGTHTVDIKKDSWLYKVLGNKVVTNSFHHQAVKDIAPGFEIVARSKDGGVEAIEKLEGSFCVAVQWHPEMMQKRYPVMLKIFRAFIAICAENKKQISN